MQNKKIQTATQININTNITKNPQVPTQTSMYINKKQKNINQQQQTYINNNINTKYK